MTTQLTNEQMARVFAMYVGQKVQTYDSILTLCHSSIGVKDGISLSFCVAERKYIMCKLLLTPLSAISDEDAIEVAKINASRNYVKLLDNPKLPANVFQYLIQKGYAVPLFFEPNHPLNGQTAIELGLAIDKTKEVSHG